MGADRGALLPMAVRAVAALALAAVACGPAAAQDPLRGKAAELYRQALQTGRFGADAARLKATLRPTSDGRSFFLVQHTERIPSRWIVSLHGAGRPARGFATDDAVVWQPHLENRPVGLVCLQWWLGTGDASRDFLAPMEIYREVDLLLRELKVAPQAVMLHGFSRGATNTYAVTALDHGRGRRYFALVVASSGGVALDYPPNQALLRGEFGADPLRGTRWVTAAGARDPEAERDGVAGMRRTADWLRRQGASVVESIEDPAFGHGALHLNARNVARVLDLFLQ